MHDTWEKIKESWHKHKGWWIAGIVGAAVLVVYLWSRAKSSSNPSTSSASSAPASSATPTYETVPGGQVSGGSGGSGSGTSTSGTGSGTRKQLSKLIALLQQQAANMPSAQQIAQQVAALQQTQTSPGATLSQDTVSNMQNAIVQLEQFARQHGSTSQVSSGGITSTAHQLAQNYRQQLYNAGRPFPVSSNAKTQSMIAQIQQNSALYNQLSVQAQGKSGAALTQLENQMSHLHETNTQLRQQLVNMGGGILANQNQYGYQPVALGNGQTI